MTLLPYFVFDEITNFYSKKINQ